MVGRHREQQIAVFWTVRTLLAPLIEGLILLDRALYLQDECGASAALLPLFDPNISPRSFVVVGARASKDPSKMNMKR